MDYHPLEQNVVVKQEAHDTTTPSIGHLPPE
jgi:hypothetical protein